MADETLYDLPNVGDILLTDLLHISRGAGSDRDKQITWQDLMQFIARTPSDPIANQTNSYVIRAQKLEITHEGDETDPVWTPSGTGSTFHSLMAQRFNGFLNIDLDISKGTNPGNVFYTASGNVFNLVEGKQYRFPVMDQSDWSPAGIISVVYASTLTSFRTFDNTAMSALPARIIAQATIPIEI